MNPKLLTIIVTYNGIRWIDRCINSIISSSVHSDIIVIDNGSTDGTQERIRERWNEVLLIQSDENLGFGRANNIGFDHALKNGYEYVYLLNQDAWVETDTFCKLIEMHERHPEFGIISPIQMEANLQKMDKGFLEGVASKTIGESYLNDMFINSPKEIYKVRRVMAAHWMLSISCIRKVGAFSPTFRHYGEDDNYMQRAEYHGYQTGIVPSCRAVHDRESRKMTKDKRAYSCYVKTLTAMSDISGKTRWMRVVKMYFEYAYEYRMIRHFRYLFTCIMRLREINRNKKESRREGAFLMNY